MGRGAAQFKYVPTGGPVVGKLRSDLGSGDGQAVHLFKDASVSRVIVLRRRLGCVLSVLDGISKNGLTLSRDLELSVQWDAIVSGGPCGPLCGANLAFSPAVGFSFFGDHVRVLYDVVVDFLRTRLLFTVETLLYVVGVLGCWKMAKFILIVGLSLTWWLLHLSSVVILVLLLMVVGLFLILIVLMSNFVLLGFPSFVGQAEVPLILLLLIGRLVVGSHRLGEFDLPPLLGDVSFSALFDRCVSPSRRDVHVSDSVARLLTTQTRDMHTSMKSCGSMHGAVMHDNSFSVRVNSYGALGHRNSCNLHAAGVPRGNKGVEYEYSVWSWASCCREVCFSTAGVFKVA